MGKLVKKFLHKGVEYEIRLIRRFNGEHFLKVFKEGNLFNPYYYNVPKGIIAFQVQRYMGGKLLLDYLISQVEGDIVFWVENKDKIKLK
jgi:hypothetical protein